MKLKAKRDNVIIIIIASVLCIMAIYASLRNSRFKETLVVLTSFGAGFAVFIQIKGSRDLAIGEFILNLQQEYSANEKNCDLFIKCWNSLKDKEPLELKKEDRADILNYLTFFESLYIMVENNILSLEILDELFGRRFFVVVNNVEIQKKDLAENYLYYLNVYRLHALWKEYRCENNNNLFSDDNALQEKKDSKPKDGGVNSYLKDLQSVLKEKCGAENSLYSKIYKNCPE